MGRSVSQNLQMPRLQRSEAYRKEPLHFKIDGKNIAELAMMDISELSSFFTGIGERMSKRQLQIASEVNKEIVTRLSFLLDVGLNYLSLDRPSATLSGGESQRIRLATQIGSQLVNVLYILDEPSIGLHHRDNLRLNPVTSATARYRQLGHRGRTRPRHDACRPTT